MIINKEKLRCIKYLDLIKDVLDKNLMNPLIELTDKFIQKVNIKQTEEIINILEKEFIDYNLTTKKGLIKDLSYMRAIMIPINNDDLALSLSRLWVFGTYCDDICEYNKTNSFMFLKNAFNVGDDLKNDDNITKYCNYAFLNIKPFCDDNFFSCFMLFFYQSFIGTLFECELFFKGNNLNINKNTADYIRSKNGFCEFWFLSLQFINGFEFNKNMKFWIEIMKDAVDFLNDFNDVCSFYKEALDENDFLNSRIYKISKANDCKYYISYKYTLDHGLKSYNNIINSAINNNMEIEILKNYMEGFIYWHFHSKRYCLKDIFPDIEYN